MTNFPEDDLRLSLFLRQYRSAVPPAAPDLEERILQGASSRSRHRQARQLWVVPPKLVKLSAGMAAGLLITLVGYRANTPQPASPNPASIEAFLETNWDGVVSDRAGAPQSNTTESDWQVVAARYSEP